MLFSIKQYIKKPKEEKSIDFQESKKEKMIEDYLNDTYNLTKILNEQKEKKKDFSWNKRRKK